MKFWTWLSYRIFGYSLGHPITNTMEETFQNCMKKSNCDRPKNHPGICSKRKSATIEYWKQSPFIKQQKLTNLDGKLKNLSEEITTSSAENVDLKKQIETLKIQKDKIEKKVFTV